MILFDLLGFQFLALLDMEREAYHCRIVAWDYPGLCDYARAGTLSEFKTKNQTEVNNKVGSELRITSVLSSNKLLAVLRGPFGGDHPGFSWSFCTVTPTNLKLCAVRLIILWTVLGPAVACDGGIGLDDPFEACLPNACFNSAVALMATCYSAISGIFQPTLSPVSWIFFNTVPLFLCRRICLHAFFCLFAKQF